MIKNLTATAVVMLATLTVAQAESNFKSGFNFGGGVGYKHSQSTTKASFIDVAGGGLAGIQNEDFSKTGTSRNASFEVHAGWDFILSRLYTAIDVDYRYTPGSKTETSFQTKQANLGIGEKPFSGILEHHNDLGLSGSLGGLITDNLALFAIANVRYGHFTLKFNNNKPVLNAIQDGKKGDHLWGYGGGLGARYAFTDGLSMAVRVTYDIYDKIKIKDNLGGVDTFTVRSERPQVISMMFRVSKRI